MLSVPGVAASTPFLYAEVMLSAGQNLTGAMLKGIDTATLGKVTEIPRSLEKGRLEWLDRPEEIPPARPRPGLADALDGAGGPRPEPDGAPATHPPPRRSPGSCSAASWRAGCASASGTW